MQKTIITIVFFLLGCKAFAIDPSKDYNYTPDSFNIKYTTHTIPVKNDTIKLYSWELMPNVAYNGKTIIIAGGDRGNMGDIVGSSLLFLDKGFKVILFDYRGFGKSSDFKFDKRKIFYSQFGDDLFSAVEYYKTKDAQSKYGVFGYSLGCLAYNCMAEKLKLDFLILDSPPLDVNKGIKVLKKNLYPLPKEDNDKILQNFSGIKIPFLCFIGTKDIFINLGAVNKLTNNKTGTLIIYNGKHLAAGEYFTNEVYGDVYDQIILSFLAKE